MVLYEYLSLSPHHAIGLVGFAIFVGVQILLNSRKIGGDGLVFFAGNTVAAALVLASNFGGFHLVWVLAQIVLIACAMTAMIVQFLDAAEQG